MIAQFFITIFLVSYVSWVSSCSDFYMNFTNFHLSARTLDLGTQNNWSITTWPRKLSMPNEQYAWPARYGTVGISGNWLGDEREKFPIFFADSLNEKGVSCSLLTLVNTKYQDRDDSKTNVFAGTFCHYVAQNYASVAELQKALETIAIYGPDMLAQHFLVRDRAGQSLIIELVDGKQNVYLDKNDDVTGFGIMTNEPTFNWHLQNIQHYQWKRNSLSRQSVAIPGNFYPEERFLRVYMMKQGMQSYGLMETTSYQTAVALTAQVLNTISVPQGNQYGTDSGDGEGENDHSAWGVIRDHDDPTIYW
jgi:penicillin V acylase-like amidase (Ntn superfamily)